MALTGFTMTQASQILKVDYLPVVREQIPTKTPLFARLNKGTEDVVGSEAKIALRTMRNQGVGARADGAQLPVAGFQQYRNFSVTTKNLYGRIEIAGMVFRAAKTDRGAFINAVDAEMKGMTEALQWDLNRQLFGTNNGVLATLGALSSGTTYAVTASDASYITRWLQQNMLVDVYDTTLVTQRSVSPSAGYLTISSVDKSANTVTFNGTATSSVSGDKVVRNGSKGNELTGLKSVFTVDTAIYGTNGIDRTTAANKFFNPQRLHNSGSNRAISEILLQTAWDEAEINAGGMPTLMISTHGVRRSYQNLLTALKQYVEPKKLLGGWTALDYNGCDWVVDPDMEANNVYFLDETTWKIHSMIPELFDWGEEDNQVLRQVTNYDAYEAFMVAYMELVCDAPAKNVVLEDITEG